MTGGGELGISLQGAQGAIARKMSIFRPTTASLGVGPGDAGIGRVIYPRVNRIHEDHLSQIHESEQEVIRCHDVRVTAGALAPRMSAQLQHEPGKRGPNPFKASFEILLCIFIFLLQHCIYFRWMLLRVHACCIAHCVAHNVLTVRFDVLHRAVPCCAGFIVLSNAAYLNLLCDFVL